MYFEKQFLCFRKTECLIFKTKFLSEGFLTCILMSHVYVFHTEISHVYISFNKFWNFVLSPSLFARAQLIGQLYPCVS